MSWKDILKLDIEERIRGILSNWLDSVLDWSEEVKGEITNQNLKMQEEYKQLLYMISEAPEYLQEAMRNLAPTNIYELFDIMEETSEKVDELMKVLDTVKSMINNEDIEVNRILNSIQTYGLVESIAAMDSFSDHKSPTAPNMDRLIGQLTLGEGYEE